MRGYSITMLMLAGIAATATGCIVIEDYSQLPYEYCSRTTQCEDAQTVPTHECFDVILPSTNGKSTACTEPCSFTADCPQGRRGFFGSCYSVEGSDSICWQQCNTSNDCRGGWFCAKADDGFGIVDTICVPGTLKDLDASSSSLEAVDDGNLLPDDTASGE